MKTKSLVMLGLGLVVVAGLGPRTAAQAPAALKQAAFIKASNPGEMDQLGSAIAVSGDGNTLAVGAPQESSKARGVNGDQANDALYASGAVYVYTRSPKGWVQQAYVKAANPSQSDQFGSIVALSDDGNTLAVGAHFEDSKATGVNGDQADNSMEESGAVYVFSRTGTTWSQQAYVKASNTGEVGDGDTFGISMALSDDGNTLAVGAPSEDSNASGINGNQADNSAVGAGAVYVYTRAGTTWSQQAYIKSDAPPNFTAGDLFGYSVALNANGNTLAVGVYDEAGSGGINAPLDNKAPGSGAVYVFTRTGTTWAREAILKAKEQDRNDSMGVWVAISDDGNTLAAGAADEDTMTTGVNVVQSGHTGRTGTPDDWSSGAAYVFTRTGTTWSEQASFKASNTGKEDWFGIRLALSGDGNTFAVSAPNEDSAAKGINGKQDDESASEAGAVYLFTRSGATWSQQAYVKGSNTEQFDEFGSAVALSRDGRTFAVGARFQNGGAKGVNGNQADKSVMQSGAAYVFVR